MGFLDDLKVVDATRLLPGGYCTMLLSDMGAEVVKVEQPGLGDYMRATPPTRKGRSPLHETVNRNKLSIGIDLKEPEGKQVMRRLLKDADVFVEGFRPGAIGRLGFSFPDVRRVSPKIVYCSISAYGQGDRLSSMPAHDVNFQAMAGTLAYGKYGSVPQLQLGDMVSGMYAAVAILGALAMKKRQAVRIDVPIVQSLLSWMVMPVSAYIATGEAPTEGSSLIFGSTPYYNTYRTSDGKRVAVAAIEHEFWRNLVRELGVPEIEQKRFGTKDDRAVVARTLTRIFAGRPRAHWESRLMSKDTCVTPVLEVDEALGSEWAKAGSLLFSLDGDGQILNNPVKASPEVRSGPFTRAPELGEHTGRIMKSLGYSASQTSRLKKAGVVQ
ncbi:MAG: CoA transferase [Thaumarchaeota archaeon]|nr:CoA transferase [Nitrososphaerota archaeon]